MPSNKFILPTGYEDEQRKAESKRKLAQAMLERGLTNNPNMQNWAQVLAQLGSAYAGMRLNKKADKLDSDVNSRMLADYTKRSSDFDAATGGGSVDPAAIVRRFSADPMMQDRVKPYVDALSHRLSQQEDIVKTPTTYARQGDLVGKPVFDPNASIIPDGQGGYKVNPLRVTSALQNQAYGFNEGDPMQTSMTDPTQGQQAPAPQMYAPPTPAPGDAPLNTSLLTPEERQIMAAELARRSGQGGTATLQNDTHVPMGNPLTAQRAPAGVVNGKPYWLINGVPYDNPEGK